MPRRNARPSRRPPHNLLPERYPRITADWQDRHAGIAEREAFVSHPASQLALLANLGFVLAALIRVVALPRRIPAAGDGPPG
jgi:hypothetical protein